MSIEILFLGEVSDLFNEEETEEIVSAVRGEVKALGIFDSRENCWKFFLDKVRHQLKVSHFYTTLILTILVVVAKSKRNGYI